MLYGEEGGYDVKQVRSTASFKHPITAWVLILCCIMGDVQDAKRAQAILDKACDDSIADSCYALASHLLRQPAAGSGPKREPLRAKALLEKGCDRGHGPSCFNLAVMYKKGDEGIPR